MSFMHLPGYLADIDIIRKLEGWRITPISKIRRRHYTDTDRGWNTFSKSTVSQGGGIIAIQHAARNGGRTKILPGDAQTCRLCMSPEHMFRDCPDFQCYKCRERGHFARECQEEKCLECQEYLNKCNCREEEQMHEHLFFFEEGEQMNEGQEEDGTQQKEMEGERNNREQGKKEKDHVNNINDHAMEQSLKERLILDSNTKAKETDSENREKEQMDERKGEDGQQQEETGYEMSSREQGGRKNEKNDNSNEQNLKDMEILNCSKSVKEKDSEGEAKMDNMDKWGEDNLEGEQQR